MKHIRFLIFWSGLITLSACEKVIEPKNIPQQDSRIVLNSVLFTGSQISANISASKSILSGKDYKYINNATCAFYENDVFMENLLFSQKGTYYGTTKIKSNTKYKMEVSAPGYSMVTASTYIPGSVTFTNIQRYDTINSDYYIVSYGGPLNLNGTTKYKVTILDDISVKNYYSIEPIITFFDGSGNQIPVTISPNISENTTGNGGSALQVDDLTRVNSNEIQLDVSVNFALNLDTLNIKKIQVQLNFYNLSEDYYKYVTAVNKQSSSGISLFAEPVLDYSNVVNGMGILAGASMTSTVVYTGAPKSR